MVFCIVYKKVKNKKKIERIMYKYNSKVLFDNFDNKSNLLGC